MENVNEFVEHTLNKKKMFFFLIFLSFGKETRKTETKEGHNEACKVEIQLRQKLFLS
jgi:hypothetical protein